MVAETIRVGGCYHAVVSHFFLFLVRKCLYYHYNIFFLQPSRSQLTRLILRHRRSLAASSGAHAFLLDEREEKISLVFSPVPLRPRDESPAVARVTPPLLCPGSAPLERSCSRCFPSRCDACLPEKNIDIEKREKTVE